MRTVFILFFLAFVFATKTAAEDAAVPSPIVLTELNTGLIVGPRPEPPKTDEITEAPSTLAEITVAQITEPNFNGTHISLDELNLQLVPIVGYWGKLKTKPNGTESGNETAIASSEAVTSVTEIVIVTESDSETSKMTTVPLDQEDESDDTVSTTIDSKFDCRRTGHDCDPIGGLCDLDTGTCVCANENITTFTCAHDRNWFVDKDNCNNGDGCGTDPNAFCVGYPDNTMCSCPYHLYGDACEKPAYELRCSSTFMTINITPYGIPGGFQGQIYVVERDNSSKVEGKICAFSPLYEGVSTLRLRYSDVVEKCGGESPDKDTYEIRFVIQSNAQWLTSYDQLITARCTTKFSQEFQKTIIVDATSKVNVSHDLSNLAAEGIDAERKSMLTRTVVPHTILTISQEQKDENGNTVQRLVHGSVRIGDLVILKIENLNETFYKALRAEQCTLKLDDMLSTNILEQQCPASRLAWSLMQWSRTEVTKSSLSFYVHIPANANAGHPRQLTVTCQVKFCAEDVTDQCAASPDNCKSVVRSFLVTGGASRKRRAAQDETKSTAIVTLTKTVNLDYGEPNHSDLKSSPSTAANVFASAGVIAFAAISNSIL